MMIIISVIFPMLFRKLIQVILLYYYALYHHFLFAVTLSSMYKMKRLFLSTLSYIIIVLSFDTVDATLTQEVKKFVSNKSLLNPNIDTSVTIFGRHSGKKAEFLNIRRKFG